MTEPDARRAGHLPAVEHPAAAQDLPGPHTAARVRLFNVKYSANLGDGLLSECLEAALIACGADRDTWSVDLAGRTAFGAGAAQRSAQMRVLEALPQPLRRPAARLPLAWAARRQWRPHYRESLKEADCVVIGGGNLLADLDLNFPTKIALAVGEAARRGLPVFLYGCGVSGDWSRAGRTLLQRALRTGAVRRVFVRDERSRQAWNALAGTASGLEAIVVRDPGLLAAERYRLENANAARERSRIGLNITSQLALRYHSERAPSPRELDAWYLDFARAVLAEGHELAIFTNGSPEDRACLARLRPAFEAMTHAAAIDFTQAATPAALARRIASLRALAAFRMHAVIAAYACGVPFLALAWDPKLDAFVQSIGHTEWLCRPSDTSGTAGARQLLAAAGAGIPAAERSLVIAQARRGVAMLFDEIAAARA